MKNVSILTFVFAVTLFFSFSSARYAIACEKSATTQEQNAEREISSEKSTTTTANDNEQEVKRPYRHIGKLAGD